MFLVATILAPAAFLWDAYYYSKLMGMYIYNIATYIHVPLLKCCGKKSELRTVDMGLDRLDTPPFSVKLKYSDRIIH